MEQVAMGATEVVITGVGVVSPVGIGREAFWSALTEGRSGIHPATLIYLAGHPVPLAGEVRDFDPKAYVANRKSLKVMSRDAQLGLGAALLACREANVVAGQIDPERFGVVLGADQICAPIQESETTYGQCLRDGKFDFSLWGSKGMSASFPLGFLRVLPNMIASHVSIHHDARGPNNTIHEGEVSSLLAVIEAASVIQRGMADIMLAGGASSQLHLLDFVRRQVMGLLSPRHERPETVVRPFDARRDGQVWSEGAGTLVLESRAHAEARGAKILACLRGWGIACEPSRRNGDTSGDGLRRAIRLALDSSGVRPADLGHVNAHGLSTVCEDAIEARALGDVVPDVPVAAYKGHFGNVGAAGGTIEMAASVLSLGQGCVPVTLNYECPDPQCPLPVIHGEPLKPSTANCLCVNWMPMGQAAAVVLSGPA